MGTPSKTLKGTDFAELWANSSAELRANSSAELWENSSAELWENSSAVLRENSSAVLRANSSAVLWANSSAVLRENSSAVLRENSSAVLKSPTAVVWLMPGFTGKVTGRGHIIRVKNPTSIAQWAKRNDATIKAGRLLVGKALDADLKSPHGTAYIPGTTVTAPDWDKGQTECGGGLHACSTPHESKMRYLTNAKRFVVLSVAVADCRKPQATDQMPDKIKFRTAKVLYECDEDGKKIEIKKESRP